MKPVLRQISEVELPPHRDNVYVNPMARSTSITQQNIIHSTEWLE
jgi:hypothetical protein